LFDLTPTTINHHHNGIEACRRKKIELIELVWYTTMSLVREYGVYAPIGAPLYGGENGTFCVIEN
jgi:hypothetical protein